MILSKKNLLVIVQARMGSSRLPGKSLLKLGDKFLIEHVLDQILEFVPKEQIVLATTQESSDDGLVSFVKSKYQIYCFRGSTEDVRSRFLQICDLFSPQIVLRITADDPFKSPLMMNDLFQNFLDFRLPYLCNFEPRLVPIGQDLEFFDVEFFRKVSRITTDASNQEHVTPEMRLKTLDDQVNLVDSSLLKKYSDLIDIRFTIDTEEDYLFCSHFYREYREIFDHLNYDVDSIRLVLSKMRKSQ